MSIEEIIRAWKSDESNINGIMPANSVGRELSEEEMKEVTGVLRCPETCIDVSAGCTLPVSNVVQPSHDVNRERLLQAAMSIGDRLHSLALTQDKAADWLSVVNIVGNIKKNYWVVAPTRNRDSRNLSTETY